MLVQLSVRSQSAMVTMMRAVERLPSGGAECWDGFGLLQLHRFPNEEGLERYHTLRHIRYDPAVLLYRLVWFLGECMQGRARLCTTSSKEAQNS